MGHNLYSYCENDPINNTDTSGTYVVQKIAEVFLYAVFGIVYQLFIDFALYLFEKLVNENPVVFDPDPGDYVDAALEWAFDAIKLFPKRKKYIAQFLSSMIRAISAQIVNYIAGKQIKLNSVLNTVAADALVCVVYAILNKKTYNKIKKLNKGIYKNKKLKNEKLKIRIEYKALGKKIKHYIEIGDDLFAFVMKVVDRL